MGNHRGRLVGNRIYCCWQRRRGLCSGTFKRISYISEFDVRAVRKMDEPFNRKKCTKDIFEKKRKRIRKKTKTCLVLQVKKLVCANRELFIIHDNLLTDIPCFWLSIWADSNVICTAVGERCAVITTVKNDWTNKKSLEKVNVRLLHHQTDSRTYHGETMKTFPSHFLLSFFL